MNHKKLRRLYREERLQVRRRSGRKRALGTRAPMTIPQAPNQRWSLDFLSDAFADGRRFRILAVVDDFTRECLTLVADTSLSGLRVARELEAVIAHRGRPAMCVSDNGTELTGMAILRWTRETRKIAHTLMPRRAAPINPLVIELLDLTTLPASLCLTITRAEAWNVERCRTNALTRIILGRAICKACATGICDAHGPLCCLVFACKRGPNQHTRNYDAHGQQFHRGSPTLAVISDRLLAQIFRSSQFSTCPEKKRSKLRASSTDCSIGLNS